MASGPSLLKCQPCSVATRPTSCMTAFLSVARAIVASFVQRDWSAPGWSYYESEYKGSVGALYWPMLCVCCAGPPDENIEIGIRKPGLQKVSAPICIQCLRHSVFMTLRRKQNMLFKDFGGSTRADTWSRTTTV